MAFRTGYGVGFYSADAYGIDSNLIEGAASGSATSSVAVAYERVISASAAASATSSASATGYTAITGAASTAATSSVALYWNRVRPFSAADSAQASNVVYAREKWIDTTVASVSWTDADYREGAA